MYACQYCDAVFAQSIELSRHVRTHTGDKPYVCRECGKGFRQANGLSIHLRSFHSECDQLPPQLWAAQSVRHGFCRVVAELPMPVDTYAGIASSHRLAGCLMVGFSLPRKARIFSSWVLWIGLSQRKHQRWLSAGYGLLGIQHGKLWVYARPKPRCYFSSGS